MTKKPNEERKAEKDLILNQNKSFSNQLSLQKTSKEIFNKLADLELSCNSNPKNKEWNNAKQKKWLPADKAVLIEDVEKILNFIKIEVNGQPTDRSIQHFKTQIVSYIIPLAKQKLKSLKVK